MPAPTYIAAADVTDSTLKEAAFLTRLTAKLVLSDGAVEDLAQRKGVEAAEIKVDPVHYILKEFAVAWVCERMCLDEAGRNKSDSLLGDVYMEKYKEYKKLRAEKEAQVNYEILVGTADEERERPGPRTGNLLFGG